MPDLSRVIFKLVAAFALMLALITPLVASSSSSAKGKNAESRQEKEDEEERAHGILIYLEAASQSKTKAQSIKSSYKDLSKWLSERGYVRVHRFKRSPIEHWAEKRNPKKAVAQEKALCQRLLQDFSHLIRLCDANTETKPTQSESAGHGSSSPIPASEALAAQKSCALHATLGGEGETEDRKNLGLTTFWAQEYVGADLAFQRYEELSRQWDEKSKPLSKVHLGIMDTWNANHGIHVSQLIFRNTPRSVFQTEQNLGFMELSNTGSYNDAYLRLLDTASNKFDVINISMRAIGEVVFERFRDITNIDKTLFVIGAGNEFPEFEDTKQGFQEGIMVGSLSPRGWMSKFSSEFPNVTIVAPSDYYIVVADHKQPFGGTSGAAPLVSSALSMVKSFLPALNYEQAKELLRATALPTLNAYEDPQHNGAGTLNTYQLVEWSAKIRERCHAMLNAPQEFKACFERKITELKNQPHSLNQGITTEVQQVFSCPAPHDLSDEQRPRGDLCQKKELFDRLRKAALLNSHVSPYWQQLACIHEKEGYKDNAEFYRSLALVGWPRPSRDQIIQKIAENVASSLNNQDSDVRWTATRSLSSLARSHPAQAAALIERTLKDSDTSVREGALWSLSSLARSYPTEAAALIERALKDSDLDVRRDAIRSLPSLAERSPTQAAPLIESVLKDSNSFVRQLGVNSLSALVASSPAQAAHLIETFLDNSNSRVRADAARFLSSLVGRSPQAAPLIESALKDSTSDVRVEAARALSFLARSSPAQAAPLIESALKDSSAGVRDAATRAQSILSTP